MVYIEFIVAIVLLLCFFGLGQHRGILFVSASLEQMKGEDSTKQYSLISRAFEPHQFTCLAASESDMLNITFQNTVEAEVGLLYQKTPKCASTTSSGVNLRIARNIAARTNTTGMCYNSWAHGKSSQWKFATRFHNRNREQSFLWTLIREPTARYASHYFFGPITSNLVKPSVKTFQDWLEFKLSKNMKDIRKEVYYCYLSTQRNTSCDELPESEYVTQLNDIMLEYDFIGVTERYDESLIVLMMLLDLKMGDVIYFKSKTSGSGYTAGRGKNRACLPIAPKELGPAFKTFFDSDEWQDHIKWDRLFHQAVNRSLDLTIDRLGRTKVEANLARFQEVQKVVLEQCEGHVKMPCDDTVSSQRPIEETDCLYEDIGCGMDCLDKVADELRVEVWK
jgi:hypothetical protein